MDKIILIYQKNKCLKILKFKDIQQQRNKVILRLILKI